MAEEASQLHQTKEWFHQKDLWTFSTTKGKLLDLISFASMQVRLLLLALFVCLRQVRNRETISAAEKSVKKERSRRQDTRVNKVVTEQDKANSQKSKLFYRSLLQ